MIADTTTRVPRHTPQHLNQRIEGRARQSVARHAANPEQIDRRLAELDREWDIERMLETNASSLVVLGTLLGTWWSAWFYWIPFLVGSFLLQHAIQGWCPPIRLFRRLGFRTQAEIATEHYALRALRGDFDDLSAIRDGEAKARGEAAYRAMEW